MQYKPVNFPYFDPLVFSTQEWSVAPSFNLQYAISKERDKIGLLYFLENLKLR